MKSQNKNNKNCYVVFSQRKSFENTFLFHETVISILKERGYLPLNPIDKNFEFFDFSRTIFDNIIMCIKKSDLVIVDISNINSNIIYELGLAHAWGKPTILISSKEYRNNSDIPFDIIHHYPNIFFHDELKSDRFFIHDLNSRIDEIELRPNIPDPLLSRYVDIKTTIAIQLLSKQLDIVEAHLFIADFFAFFKDSFNLRDFRLIESQTGSLSEIITSKESTIAKFAEKIIFFIPEWRRKNANRIKILAEADNIIAKTEQIRSETKTKEALALLEIVERSQKLGATRIIVGDKLLIETKCDGTIEIS